MLYEPVSDYDIADPEPGIDSARHTGKDDVGTTESLQQQKCGRGGETLPTRESMSTISCPAQVPS